MCSLPQQMEPQIQSRHPHPQNPINPNPHFNIDTFQDRTQKQFMEELRDAVINLATSRSGEPLTTEHKTHVEQRLRQLFPLLHTPSHPAYAAMIHSAIEELNEEGGSSEESISGFIKANYDDLPWAHASLLSHHLGKLIAKKEIVVTGNKNYMLPIENPNPEKRRRNQELPIENPNPENRLKIILKRKLPIENPNPDNRLKIRLKRKLPIENPNPKKRRQKRKPGGERERFGGQSRRSGENVIEEESQSIERDREVNGEKIGRREGGIEVIEEQCSLKGEQIEMIEEQNQSHEQCSEMTEGISRQFGEIGVFDEQNRPIGRHCELIEKQNGARGVPSEVIGEHNQVGEHRIEEEDLSQEQQSEEQNQTEEEKIELIGEGNQVKEVQSEVIGEENEPQEQHSEVRTELLPSCHDHDGDALMVPPGESLRPLKSSCGERVVEVIEQICLQEQEHGMIEPQFQPNEQEVEERSKILPLGRDVDGDALMVLSGESGRDVVEEEKNESLMVQEEEQQTGSPFEEREFDVEVIEEQCQPHEQIVEVTGGILPSCHDGEGDGDGDALMVGESGRHVVEEEKNESLMEEEEQQTGSPFGEREFDVKVIEEQCQPHEQIVEVTGEILPSCYDGEGDGDDDALMVLSGEFGRHVVEEEKNESLMEEEEEQQTGSPYGEREFDVEVIEEQCQPNEQIIEVTGEILPSCHDGDGDDLVVPFGESQMLVVEEEKNEYLAEEQQQHQTESPLERREFLVEVVEEQSQASKQENEATGELKQQNEVIEEQFQPQEEQIEVKTQILRSCQDGEGDHCDGNDLRVQPIATAKPIMKGKKKRSLEEGKHKETKVPCEGKEIAVICALPVQQWQQKSKSDRQKSTKEETSQTMEKQAKRRGRKKQSTSQPTTMTTSLDLPLTSRQGEPEQQQEFPNQERPLELKRMRVEEFSETQEQQQQETQEKLQQRQLRSWGRGPLKTEPTAATTMEALLSSQHEEQQQQPQRRGRGRPPKPKSDADTNHQHQHKQQQTPSRGRGRPPQPKLDADTTIADILAQQKKPKPRKRGRPPKSNLDAGRTTGHILNSKNQQKKPRHRGRGRPPKPKSDADTSMGKPVDLKEPTAVTRVLRSRKASETRLKG